MLYAAPVTRDWPPLGSEVGSSYRLVSRLGEGAVGVVYLASRGGESRFAVKVLGIDAADGRSVARFVREAHVASNLKSEHVLPVVESGVDRATGLCFLAMPAIDGEDLERVIERTGALPPATAVRIAIEAARGLDAAHEAGVIHRDVKPANLLLSYEGPLVRTLVADFGIAKEVTSVDALTSTGTRRRGSARASAACASVSARTVTMRSITTLRRFSAASASRSGDHALGEAITPAKVAHSATVRRSGGRPNQARAAWATP